MSIPLQISFRNLKPSSVTEEMIEKKAAKLEQFYDRITGIEVQVEQPHRSQLKGRRYNVRITISVPGSSLVVSRQSGDEEAEANVASAVNNAFRAARRELQEYAESQREIRRAETVSGSSA